MCALNQHAACSLTRAVHLLLLITRRDLAALLLHKGEVGAAHAELGHVLSSRAFKTSMEPEDRVRGEGREAVCVCVLPDLCRYPAANLCLEQQGVPISVTAGRHCTESYDKHTSCAPAHMALLSCALPQDLCYQLMKGRSAQGHQHRHTKSEWLRVSSTYPGLYEMQRTANPLSPCPACHLSSWLRETYALPTCKCCDAYSG
jgi:hypothetical protein